MIPLEETVRAATVLGYAETAGVDLDALADLGYTLSEVERVTHNKLNPPVETDYKPFMKTSRLKSLLAGVLMGLSSVSFAASNTVDIPVSGSVYSSVTGDLLGSGEVKITTGFEGDSPEVSVLPVIDGQYSGYATPIGDLETNWREAVREDISQNYPNSFVSNTKIDYYDHGWLELFTVSGEEIIPKTRLNGENKVFDLNGLSSGMYLVRFTDDEGNTTTKKMVAIDDFSSLELKYKAKPIAVKSLAKVASDSVDAIFEVSVDGYQTLVDTIKLAVSGPNENDFYLDPLPKIISGQLFNQRGKNVKTGTIRLLYNGKETTVNVTDGAWSAEVPKNISEIKFLFDNDDYNNRFLAIQKPGQQPDEHNIGQAALVGPYVVGEAYMDTAKVDLTLPDSIITNLQVYVVADSAMNDTVKQIIDGAGGFGCERWIYPHTVEILTKDPSDGGIVPQDRTDARIRIVEDYQKHLTLENGKLLISVDYIVNEETQQSSTYPPNWVRMYRDNTASPGHAEKVWPERGSAIMYGLNHVNALNNINTIGSEFHGNHFRSDPESMTLGGYALNPDGTLNKKGIDMLFIYLFNDGTRFRQ